MRCPSFELAAVHGPSTPSHDVRPTRLVATPEIEVAPAMRAISRAVRQTRVRDRGFDRFAVIAAVIVTGYVVGRLGIIGEHALMLLSRMAFVFSPCLLFTVLTDADVRRLFSSVLVVSGLTRVRRRRHLRDHRGTVLAASSRPRAPWASARATREREQHRHPRRDLRGRQHGVRRDHSVATADHRAHRPQVLDVQGRGRASADPAVAAAETGSPSSGRRLGRRWPSPEINAGNRRATRRPFRLVRRRRLLPDVLAAAFWDLAARRRTRPPSGDLIARGGSSPPGRSSWRRCR